jgi:hypothetical protein
MIYSNSFLKNNLINLDIKINIPRGNIEEKKKSR